MSTLQTGTKLTYEEYLETPETMIRCEVVDGEVIMAGPSLYHQIISGNINELVRAFVLRKRLGRVFMRPSTSSCGATPCGCGSRICCSSATSEPTSWASGLRATPT